MSLKLSETSALVLLWASKESYFSIKAHSYLDNLDLSTGNLLYKKCQEICPYYDQVIKNRKWGIANIVKTLLADSKDKVQIIIAGSGLDPLGIDLVEQYLNIKVFELDKDNMKMKSTLYQNPRISFITADLLNCLDFAKKLISYGWDKKEKTILILEGISYYISKLDMINIIKTINPNHCIFEFLKGDHLITSENSKIANKVFSLIANYCQMVDIQRYNASNLVNDLNLDMTLSLHYNQQDIEKARLKENKFFLEENSGWIDIVLLDR